MHDFSKIILPCPLPNIGLINCASIPSSKFNCYKITMSTTSSSPHTMTPEFCSGALVEEKRFLWKIENFDVVRQSDELLGAQKIQFKIGATIGLPTSWNCFLSLSAEPGTRAENAPKDCIGIFFKLDKKPDHIKEVNVAFDIKVKRSLQANAPVNYSIVNVPFKNMADISTVWGAPRMCKRNRNQDSNFFTLIEGSLWIEIYFKLYVPKLVMGVTLSLAEKLKAFEPKSTGKLLEDLAKTDALANSSAVTKIITMDKKEFAVNRGILSARSDVFQRMFQTQMTEAATGLVRIEDLSGKTLAVLLQYLSTGTLHNDWKSTDVLWELTYAADKYNLCLLKEFLDDALIDVCSQENAKHLAVLTEKLGMKKAEKDLIDLIKSKVTSAQDLILEPPPAKKCKPSEN